MEPIRPIQPELLAAKIEKIQNFEYPELLEQFGKEPQLISALWFLQFVSQPANYAGGLGRFASDFVDAQSRRIGTARMIAVGQVKKYSVKDAAKIFGELTENVRQSLFGANTDLFEEAFIHGLHGKKSSSIEECREDWAQQFLDGLNPDRLQSRLAEIAKDELARYFKELCETAHLGILTVDHGAPWYFVNVAEALLAHISDRAESIRNRIANTEITELVTRWIQKSRNTRQSVMIIGNSRFGKTEAVKMNAEIAPGSCRLVQTPDSTAIGDLLREVARVLGLDVPLHSSVRELRERIEYVLRFSNLQLIFDESQMLLPGAFSRNTAPARLNWVRRSMMDRNIPVVFICTPQSYEPAKKRFVRTTGFAMEQFDERILKTVELPKELSEEDLIAVARIHFPNQRDEYLQFVVEQAIATERNFVSDIGKIALLSKDNAQAAGRRLPILADIEAAMADVLPTPKQSAIVESAASNNGGKPTRRKRCKATAKPLLRPRRTTETLPIPSRERRPEMISV